ncbi:MAG: hypothetical protein IFK94_15145 [Acidobacteria bacterium]|uniref:Uncharacterized protein n=1 Tax=Candidatus Polarisedimenticola svalbardensis TaxID=2886004 RepID=A0A8J6XYX0_9BACT|nr:hypothetical protein [Candidatus Polarisedimenticola svalbardensis]
MNDTLPEIEIMYREMLMARSGEERFRMGLEMFEMARAMMLAGLKNDRGKDSRERAFLRLYGDDFSKEELSRIIPRINAD